MKMVFALALAALLSACASSARYHYAKDGASEYQRTDALSECQYQVKLNKIPANEQAELVQLCMQGKGFRLKPVQ